MKIRLASKDDAQSCINCLKDSLLWNNYLEQDAELENKTSSLINSKKVYVASAASCNCLGFFAIDPLGTFTEHPYLLILSVASEHRRQGYGKMLLEKFESISFEKSDKAFLLVSSFNKVAEAFYRSNGYKKVGEIPDYVKTGISESIYMKRHQNGDMLQA